jgi:hypothetical protein
MAMQELLNELKTSHTGFRHAKSPNVPSRHAINATFMRFNLDGEQRWKFQDVHEVIVDLRGNTGGGIGGLRLMSYLTPGKREVGYSLTRKRKEKGYCREELPRFGRIASRKST